MNTQMVKRLSNGTEIHKLSDNHGTPRYRVKRGKFWIGKTLEGGYISSRAAKRFAENNG